MSTTQARLKEALMNPGKYGNISKMFIDYNPDSNDEILSRAETGWAIDQYIKSSWGLGWHPFLFKDRVYLVPDRTTYCSMISMSSSIGTKNEGEVLKKYARLYNNETIGAKGVAITSKLLESMPEFLRKTNRRCFVAERFRFHSSGLWYSDYNGKVQLFVGRNIFHNTLEADLRPVVLLPSDVLVTIGATGKDGKTPATALPITVPSRI